MEVVEGLFQGRPQTYRFPVSSGLISLLGVRVSLCVLQSAFQRRKQSTKGTNEANLRHKGNWCP